jgi:hypothetical protein
VLDALLGCPGQYIRAHTRPAGPQADIHHRPDPMSLEYLQEGRELPASQALLANSLRPPPAA